MQAASVATFPILPSNATNDLYKRVVKCAEEDPTFGVFDSEQARELSNKMVDLFLDAEQIGVQAVELRIDALFPAAIDSLWLEPYEEDTDIVEAREKTEEALRKAYRSITT